MRITAHTRSTGRLRAATAFALALALTACGSGDEGEAPETESATTAAATEGGEPTDEPTTPAEDTTAPVDATTTEETGTDVAAALERAYAGTLGEPPTDAPAPAESQSVWVVSCGESQVLCSAPSASVVEAAEVVGWSGQICDGQLNPGGWSDCIRQGVSAGSDAIITIGIDCVAVGGALGEAAGAGATTINVGATDCDVVGQDPLYSGVVPQIEGMTTEERWRDMGARQADWVIGQTDGAANVLLLEFTDPLWGPWLAAGFEDQLTAECEDCQVATTLEITNQDVAGGSLATKFSTALLEQDDVNAVVVPIDGWFLAGLAQAIEESGRADDLSVIGQGGTEANFGLIRDGRGQDATVAFSTGWNGWSGIDGLIRVLAGEEPALSGVGHQVVDAENNLPDPGEPFRYEPAVEYEDAYRDAWGVS